MVSWLTSLPALLGISTYQRPPNSGLATLDSESVQVVREAMGGQLTPPITSQTRWYLSDLEQAEQLSDIGDISQIARLMRAAQKDGVLAGVASTRFEGLVRLPRRFRGDPRLVRDLEAGHDATGGQVRSTFDDLCPPSELGLLARDGSFCGVSVAELVEVRGRDFPVLVRLDPEYLRYVWSENRWYYLSIAGRLPITPGDGRWVLHTPGGRMAPWQHGLWRAVGRAFIRKEHANLHKDNWEAKLANPARVAVAPAGATETQSLAWFRQVMAWGVNTVFGLTPGYDVKLLESNGRGYDSFCRTIEDQNKEFVIAVAGQTVTTDGGAGFQNSDIHKSIRADLIKATADTLAYTINTQVLPSFVVRRYGEGALDRGVVVEWDVTPARDRAAEAQSLVTTAQAITQLTDALAAHDRVLDVDTLCARFGIPVAGDTNGDGTPDVPVIVAGDAPRAKPVLRAVADTEDDEDDEEAA